ncbi:arsenic resistance protein [Nitriliruptoraceae bacterium ZYF776]|nr:arsenic resistance protein [Profundirhabdus halotolerans]
MSLTERLQSVLVAAAAVVGLGLGSHLEVVSLAERLVLPALVVLLVAVFVQLDVSGAGEVRRAGSLVGASLVLNFAVTPLLAWGLGSLLLAEHPELRIGLVLLLVTPCTDWYLVFTALGRGDTAIATALLPLNLVLQLALLPLFVLLLGGEAAHVDAATLVEAVVLVLVVPLLAAAVLRWGAGRRGEAWRRRWLVAPAGKVVLPALCLAVAAMFAWQARTVTGQLGTVSTLLAPLAAFFVLAPTIASLVARGLRLPADRRVTLVMTTTARNSPLALAIAVAAFPDRPLVALALVVAPLLELPVLALIGQLVRAPEPTPERATSDR